MMWSVPLILCLISLVVNVGEWIYEAFYICVISVFNMSLGELFRHVFDLSVSNCVCMCVPDGC